MIYSNIILDVCLARLCGFYIVYWCWWLWFFWIFTTHRIAPRLLYSHLIQIWKIAKWSAIYKNIFNCIDSPVAFSLELVIAFCYLRTICLRQFPIQWIVFSKREGKKFQNPRGANKQQSHIYSIINCIFCQIVRSVLCVSVYVQYLHFNEPYLCKLETQ